MKTLEENREHLLLARQDIYGCKEAYECDPTEENKNLLEQAKNNYNEICENTIIDIEYLGEDNFSNPTFKSPSGKYYKDNENLVSANKPPFKVDDNNYLINHCLHTSSDYDGDPCSPVNKHFKYRVTNIKGEEK